MPGECLFASSNDWISRTDLSSGRGRSPAQLLPPHWLYAASGTFHLLQPAPPNQASSGDRLALHGLEDEMEDVGRHFLVREPELDLLYAASAVSASSRRVM